MRTSTKSKCWLCYFWSHSEAYPSSNQQMLLFKGKWQRLSRGPSVPSQAPCQPQHPSSRLLPGIVEFSAFLVFISVAARSREVSHSPTSNQPVSQVCMWFTSNNAKETERCWGEICVWYMLRQAMEGIYQVTWLSSSVIEMINDTDSVILLDSSWWNHDSNPSQLLLKPFV